MSHLSVHIEPITAENLRKFAEILHGMAARLEPDKAALRDAILADLAAGHSIRRCAQRNGVGVGVVRGIKSTGSA